MDALSNLWPLGRKLDPRPIFVNWKGQCILGEKLPKSPKINQSSLKITPVKVFNIMLQWWSFANLVTVSTIYWNIKSVELYIRESQK